MAPMRPEGAPAYGPQEFQRDTGVSRETLARLERYAALLAKWNRAINLVSRGSLADLWQRHMLDSAQLVEHLPPRAAWQPGCLVDLGSGAGFPGLVLAIMGAGRVHLIESDQRKAAFLRQAARESGTEVTVHARRIEDVIPFTADAVTARALAPLDTLLDYAAPFLGPGTVCLFAKGKTAEQELTGVSKAWNMSVDRIPSRSDPDGTILRIEVLGRDQTRC